MLMGIMGHFTDEEAYPIVRQLLAGLPPGSYFALYDGADTNEAFNEAQRGYNESGAVPYHLRSPKQFAQFFEPWNWWSPVWCQCRTGGPTPARLKSRSTPTAGSEKALIRPDAATRDQ